MFLYSFIAMFKNFLTFYKDKISTERYYITIIIITNILLVWFFSYTFLILVKSIIFLMCVIKHKKENLN